MRGVAAGTWLVVAACSFTPNGSDGHVAPGGDGSGSGSATGQTCFEGGTAFAFCIATPTKELDLPASFLDTGTQGSHDGCMGGAYVMVGNTEACVLAGTKVTLGSGTTFGAVGDYPLVIASTGDVVIGGQVDVSTKGGAQHGAGHDPSDCARTGIDGGSGVNGAGGGAGGTFGTVGGNGGGTGGTTQLAGSAITPATPAAGLRGGCPGGGGGVGAAGTVPGNATVGGGAVLVAAKGTLSVLGFVNASGENGHGGQTGGGGGAGASGGASGGMIVVAAAVFDITGFLVANGGGGGGGGGQNNGHGSGGGSGALPDVTMPTVPAAGGPATGSDVGGPGGDGAATTGTTVTAARAGSNATANGGGGGGGGGEGVIGYLGGDFIAPTGNVSPAAFQF